MSAATPDYVVKSVKNVNGKNKWTDIGIAYRSEKGSVTVYLSALPLNEKIILIPTKGR